MEVYMIWFHSIWTIMDLHHLFNQMRAKSSTQGQKKKRYRPTGSFFLSIWNMDGCPGAPKGTDQPTSEAQESSASEEKLSKSNPNKNWN